MASMVGLFIGGLADMVSMSSDGTRVVGRVEIFGNLGRELVDELSYWILFTDFSFSLKFKGLANLTSYSTLTAPVIGFKTLIPLLSLS